MKEEVVMIFLDKVKNFRISILAQTTYAMQSITNRCNDMEHQLTIRLPSNLSVKIRQKAKRMGLKRSDIVRVALTQFLEDAENSHPIYDKVQHLLGSVSTGVSDLGEKHREYLLKKIKKRG